MSSYALQLDFPPSVNHYWRRAGHTMHISTAGKKYKADVAAAIKEAFGAVDVITGRVGVSLELYGPTKRAFDIDNYLKSLLDSIKGILIEDDGQVDMLIVKRCAVEPPGRCEVIVSEL